MSLMPISSRAGFETLRARDCVSTRIRLAAGSERDLDLERLKCA